MNRAVRDHRRMYRRLGVRGTELRELVRTARRLERAVHREIMLIDLARYTAQTSEDLAAKMRAVKAFWAAELSQLAALCHAKLSDPATKV